MNDIEKAIEVLKMENELMQFDPMTGEIKPIELQNEDNQDLYKANLIAISALEKQMARSPVNRCATFLIAECPRCNGTVSFHHKHCHWCGQNLDWEVENE